MDKRITCSDCPLCGVGTDELCEGYCSGMADFIDEIKSDAIEDAIHSLDNSKAICHEDYVDGIDFAIGVLRNIAEQMQKGVE